MAPRLRMLFWALALTVSFCEPSLCQTPIREPRPTAAAGSPAVDLAPRPLARIPVGTVIGQAAPEGWTHLVLIATPTLNPQDERDAPKMAADYARMFKFTLLADVRRAGNGPYQLRSVARGFAFALKGRDTIIDGNDVRGAELGMFGRRVLSENEKILDTDVLQVARTATMLVFDAQSVMRVGADHVPRVMRHAIVAAPDTGRLATFVWLLADDGRGGYAPVEPALQLLPPNLREARLLSVKRDRFTLGIPSRDAFALVRIPQGTAVPYTPDLRRLSAVKAFTAAGVVELESALRAIALKAANR